MDYENLIYEKIGRVAKITLNRPDRLNALSHGLRVDYQMALREANADDDVRAIVMTGAGRAFSAGADMQGGGGEGESGSAPRDPVYGLYTRLEADWDDFERAREMRRSHKPIVGAINGYALGRGFELAITCDLLIASEQAVLGAPEIRHGSIVPTFLPFLVGPMWSKRIILTGDHVSAQKAKEIGLVLDVVPHDQCVPAAMALAERIAMVPPLAVRLNKRMLDGVTEMMGLNQGQEYGALISAICHFLAPGTATAQDGRLLRDVRKEVGSLRAYLEVRDGPFGRTPL